VKTNLLELFKHEKGQPFAKGQTVFKEGDSADHWYVVKAGKVDMNMHGKTIHTFVEGELFGEMALIDHDTRSATTVAATDCELFVLDEKRFQFLVQQTPYFAQHVMKVMADRLRVMNKLA
jgi:CRP-like cAMP-binding protein